MVLCSLSFLPHSYLSFHSSASHFTYMFMQNHSSNQLARLAHLETGRIVRVTLNEVPLQPRQGAPLIKMVGMIPYPYPSSHFLLIYNHRTRNDNWWMRRDLIQRLSLRSQVFSLYEVITLSSSSFISISVSEQHHYQWGKLLPRSLFFRLSVPYLHSLPLSLSLLTHLCLNIYLIRTLRPSSLCPLFDASLWCYGRKLNNLLYHSSR